MAPYYERDNTTFVGAKSQMGLQRKNSSLKGANLNIDYDNPVKIGEDVHWVGVRDQSGAHSNPYLVVDNGNALLIDGGSRFDFPSVMMKILQTGIIPSNILALCYQNYNPQLCGSLPHLEAIISRPDLKVICDRANHMFIQLHSEAGNLLSLEEMGFQFTFPSGRRLNFVKTPFAHSAGSFVTFDHKTGILFTGDLFSTYTSQFDVSMNLRTECRSCEDFAACYMKQNSCPLNEMMGFHRNIMTSERALKYALEQIANIPFTTIAPQHGSLISEPEDIICASEHLSTLQGVGIDGLVGDRSFLNLGDITPLRERLTGSSHGSYCKAGNPNP